MIFRANGDRLQFDAPRNTFTAADRAEVSRLKPQILSLLQVPTVSAAHRWQVPDDAPDLCALALEVKAARCGAFLSPTPALLASWRELQDFVGARITSRHLGVAAQLASEYPDFDNAVLLEMFAAGVQMDDGAATPVWVASDGSHAPESPAATEVAANDDEAGDRPLLDRYRRAGAVLALEVVTHESAPWLALSVDLTGVSQQQRARADAGIERNAHRLRTALEAEGEAKPP